MDVVLLDTTVASFLHPKKKQSRELALYKPCVKGKNPALSFQTVAELWSWPESQGWGEKSRQELDAFIRRFLIIPYDYQLARIWAQVMRASQLKQKQLKAGDCWIAATAARHDITLLAHDRDFVGLDISGLNVISFVDGPKAVY